MNLFQKHLNNISEATESKPGFLDELSPVIDELEEIKQEISDSVRRARELLRSLKKLGAGSIAKRAEAYWLAHIEGALGNEGEYGRGSMTTMDDTIKELEEFGAEEPEHEKEREREWNKKHHEHMQRSEGKPKLWSIPKKI